MLNNLNVPRMATINEAAKLTGLAKYFIRQLALKNQIKNVRAGKKILINVEKLIEFLNSGDDAVNNTESNKFNIKPVEV